MSRLFFFGLLLIVSAYGMSVFSSDSEETETSNDKKRSSSAFQAAIEIYVDGDRDSNVSKILEIFRKYSKNYPHKYRIYKVSNDEGLKKESIERSGGMTSYPIVFINGRLIGGISEVEALDKSAALEGILSLK